MGQKAQSVPMHIQYGHTDETVVMVFSVPCSQLGLKPAEVDAMVSSLQDLKAKLAEHRKAKGLQT